MVQNAEARQQQQQKQKQVPMRELVNNELGTFRNELIELVRTVAESTSGRGQPPRPAALEAGARRLLQSHSQVQRAVSAVKQHLSFHKQVGEAQAKVNAVDVQLVQLNKDLQGHEQELQALTYEARQLVPIHVRKSFERKTPGRVPTLGSKRLDLSELVEFARNISYATAAPRGWHFSQAKEIPLPYKPPAPQSENLKMGLLFTEPKDLLRLMSEANARQKQTQRTEQIGKAEVQSSATAAATAAPSTAMDTDENGITTTRTNDSAGGNSAVMVAETAGSCITVAAATKKRGREIDTVTNTGISTNDTVDGADVISSNKSTNDVANEVSAADPSVGAAAQKKIRTDAGDLGVEVAVVPVPVVAAASKPQFNLAIDSDSDED